MHPPPFNFTLRAGFAAALLSLPCAFAADMPMRKSGLWEIKTESSSAVQAMRGPMTMQMCVDQSRDDLTADPRAKEDYRKHCSKMEQKRIGNRIVVDSVCSFDNFTTIGHSVITGNLATDYRMETTTRFDPPMMGMATSSSVATGKWLGPCKPGQKPGAVSYPRMPGMPMGDYPMDPVMMKRMQQMQQQYGR